MPTGPSESEVYEAILTEADKMIVALELYMQRKGAWMTVLNAAERYAKIRKGVPLS